MRVTHEDGGLDGVESVAAKGGTSTSAEGVVHDLATLRVADKDDLGVRATLVEARDG